MMRHGNIPIGLLPALVLAGVGSFGILCVLGFGGSGSPLGELWQASRILLSVICFGLAIASFSLAFVQRRRRRTGEKFTYASPWRSIALAAGIGVMLVQITAIMASEQPDLILLSGLLGPLLIAAFSTHARRLAIAGLVLAVVGTAAQWIAFLPWIRGSLWIAIAGAWCFGPILILVALLCSSTAAVRSLRQPRLPGHCHQCGYDLTGNISGRCPECGRAVPGQCYLTPDQALIDGLAAAQPQLRPARRDLRTPPAE